MGCISKCSSPCQTNDTTVDVSDIANYESFMNALLDFMEQCAITMQQVRERAGIPQGCTSEVPMHEEDRELKMNAIIQVLREQCQEEACKNESALDSTYESAAGTTGGDTTFYTALDTTPGSDQSSGFRPPKSQRIVHQADVHASPTARTPPRQRPPGQRRKDTGPPPERRKWDRRVAPTGGLPGWAKGRPPPNAGDTPGWARGTPEASPNRSRPFGSPTSSPSPQASPDSCMTVGCSKSCPTSIRPPRRAPGTGRLMWNRPNVSGDDSPASSPTASPGSTLGSSPRSYASSSPSSPYSPNIPPSPPGPFPVQYARHDMTSRFGVSPASSDSPASVPSPDPFPAQYSQQGKCRPCYSPMSPSPPPSPNPFPVQYSRREPVRLFESPGASPPQSPFPVHQVRHDTFSSGYASPCSSPEITPSSDSTSAYNTTYGSSSFNTTGSSCSPDCSPTANRSFRQQRQDPWAWRSQENRTI